MYDVAPLGLNIQVATDTCFAQIHHATLGGCRQTSIDVGIAKTHIPSGAAHAQVARDIGATQIHVAKAFQGEVATDDEGSAQINGALGRSQTHGAGVLNTAQAQVGAGCHCCDVTLNGQITTKHVVRIVQEDISSTSRYGGCSIHNQLTRTHFSTIGLHIQKAAQ